MPATASNKRRTLSNGINRGNLIAYCSLPYKAHQDPEFSQLAVHVSELHWQISMAGGPYSVHNPHACLAILLNFLLNKKKRIEPKFANNSMDYRVSSPAGMPQSN